MILGSSFNVKGQINGDNEVPKELVSIEGSYMNRVREDIFNGFGL